MCLPQNIVESVRQSPKIRKTCELVDQHVPLGQKVVIFSSWVRPLTILAAAIRAVCPSVKGVTPNIYEGSLTVAQKAKMARDFNSSDNTSMVLLVSLRSGGVGTNFQGGHITILFDQSYNPFDDLQAIYRIQRDDKPDHDITVYRLLCNTGVDRFTTSKQWKKIRETNKVIRTILGEGGDIINIFKPSNESSTINEEDDSEEITEFTYQDFLKLVQNDFVPQPRIKQEKKNNTPIKTEPGLLKKKKKKKNKKRKSSPFESEETDYSDDDDDDDDDDNDDTSLSNITNTNKRRSSRLVRHHKKKRKIGE
jgi:hypothetical protein